MGGNHAERADFRESTHRDELSHVTFIRGPQLGAYETLCLLAVVNGPQDGDGALHVEGCQVLQSAVAGKGKKRA